MDERMSSMLIFLLIFNLLFPPFAYAFTVFPQTSQTQELTIPIDASRLAQYGVSFTNATFYNITFGAVNFTYFDYNDHELRVKWIDGLAGADYVVFQKKSIVGEYLGWWWNYDVDIKLIEHDLVIDVLYNGTIIDYWNQDEDWLMMDIDYGVTGIFTTIPADSGNVTKAVMETGVLTLTVGESETSTYSFREFIDWYWNMIFNVDYTSVPSALQWFMRILTVLNLVATVFAVKDLSRV